MVTKNHTGGSTMPHTTACPHCQHTAYGHTWNRCNPKEHSPGGRDEGTLPFRKGKTKRDKGGK